MSKANKVESGFSSFVTKTKNLYENFALRLKLSLILPLWLVIFETNNRGAQLEGSSSILKKKTRALWVLPAWSYAAHRHISQKDTKETIAFWKNALKIEICPSRNNTT